MSSICVVANYYLWRIQRIGPLRMLDQKSRDFSPYFFSRTFFPVLFSRIISNYLFSRIFFPYFFFVFFYFFLYFPVFFPLLFSPVLFSRISSNVTTFQIQRFKISVSCFSSTCRYNTVHVPCEYPFKRYP